MKGALGDKLNVILSAAGMNFHKILKALTSTAGSLAHFLAWLLELLRHRLAATVIAGSR